jgi:hypothetical protein
VRQQQLAKSWSGGAAAVGRVRVSVPRAASTPRVRAILRGDAAAALPPPCVSLALALLVLEPNCAGLSGDGGEGGAAAMAAEVAGSGRWRGALRMLAEHLDDQVP